MLSWKLAIRYFLHRPSSWLAVLAVALCSFIVVVVLTVMNGLAADFKQKNHLYVGDCILTTNSLVGFPEDPNWIALLQSQPFIEAVSPSIFGVGLIQPILNRKTIFTSATVFSQPIRWLVSPRTQTG